MPLPDDIRSMAADVPVYVRPEGGRWALVASESDEALSEHDTVREALDAALTGDEAPLRTKSAVLRTDGEPDGVWRWLDASAEEDESIGRARITARSLWEMAASLNSRATPIPVNGGGAPGAEYVASEAHGDATSGGDHAANGWAHAAAIVLDKDGRTHLYLRAELLPEIAREVDRGRLAFGSVFFAYESADPDDDYAVSGATLISHALTNDPAVTTLTAGSERHNAAGAQVAFRTTRSTPIMPKNTAKRGPAYDVLKTIADMLGVDIGDEMEGDAWYSPITDRIQALKGQAVVEEIVEGGAPAEGDGEVAAQRQRALRMVEGLEGEELEASFAAMLAWAREVLGKPDAAPADALAELDARKDEVAAMLSEPAEEAMEADEDEEQAAKEYGDKDEDEDEEKSEKGARSRNPLRSARQRAARAERRVKELETREWLRGEIEKRKLGVPQAKRERYERMAQTAGREVVLEILDSLAKPPVTNPMAEGSGVAPVTMLEALRAVQPEIDAAYGNEPKHHRVARAMKLARARWPHLNETTGAA